MNSLGSKTQKTTIVTYHRNLGIVRCEEEGHPVSIGSLIPRINDKRKMGSEICELSGGFVPKVHGFEISGSTHQVVCGHAIGEMDDLAFRESSLI